MRTNLNGRGQRGVVLPLALVMLVMVTLIAVVALRGVTTEERISANLRASSVAFEQSELALRYCEQIAGAGGTALSDAQIDSTQTTGIAWRNPANWAPANAKLQKTPAAQYQQGSRLVSQPVCLIEATRVNLDSATASRRTENNAFTITARGYGDSTGGFKTTVQTQLRPPAP